MSSLHMKALFTAIGLLMWTQASMANFMDDCQGEVVKNVLPSGCTYVSATDSLLSQFAPPQPVLQPDGAASLTIGAGQATGSTGEIVQQKSSQQSQGSSGW